MPGLISHYQPLSYSGADLNYHLNPLPQFERDESYSTQKRFLDGEEVIEGLMQWKKFPSASLCSLANNTAATLSDVWIPRLSNRFSEELLSANVPPVLLDFLTDEEKQESSITEKNQ
jgi:hypothetical protein